VCRLPQVSSQQFSFLNRFLLVCGLGTQNCFTHQMEVLLWRLVDCMPLGGPSSDPQSSLSCILNLLDSLNSSGLLVLVNHKDFHSLNRLK